MVRFDRRDFLRYGFTLLATLFLERLSSSEIVNFSRLALADNLAVPSTLENPGNFKYIYSNPQLKADFYLFLKNVFHLYPEDKFQDLISAASAREATDQEIYEKIQKELPHIRPFLSQITYAMPSLYYQKVEMVKQTMDLLPNVKSVRGYLEIGSTGRYLSELRNSLRIKGPLYVVNDISPTYAPIDVAERGQFFKLGNFVPLDDYAPLSQQLVPEQSLELVTNFIGFHHSPTEKLDAFVKSIGRVLKPGGRLIVRDHNVETTEMNKLVALAHDVFDVGLDISWKLNHEQIRNFWSLAQMESYLRDRGFKREGPALLQKGDPTLNTLVGFVKA